MFRTIPRVNLPFCPGVSFSLNGWWGCFFFDVLPVFFPPFVVLAAFPRVLLPFASRIIVIASFVLLLLLLNQIQISNPLGIKKTHTKAPPNSLRRRKMPSHSRTPNETELSLSLSLSRSSTLSSLSSLSSQIVVVAINTPPTRERRDERLNNFCDDVFRPFYKTSVSSSKFASS